MTSATNPSPSANAPASSDVDVPIGPSDASASPEWQAPWVATPEHPQGAADQRPPPQTSTGHYGTGYLDPTRHYGDTLPGQPGPGQPPERIEGRGGAVPGDAPEAGEVASPDACPTPVAPAVASENVGRD